MVNDQMVNIKLRKLEPSDVVFLYQWENDASVWADGSNHNPLSQADLRDYIASTTGDIYKDGLRQRVVVGAIGPHRGVVFPLIEKR